MKVHPNPSNGVYRHLLKKNVLIFDKKKMHSVKLTFNALGDKEMCTIYLFEDYYKCIFLNLRWKISLRHTYSHGKFPAQGISKKLSLS
jgi:hypothetical protein